MSEASSLFSTLNLADYEVADTAQQFLGEASTASARHSMRRFLQDGSDSDKSSDLAAAITSNIFLFFLIFGLSATVNVKHLRQQLTNKFAIACGVAMQFFIMPLLGFLAVIALKHNGLTTSMGVALLVVTSSPGGSYSNWWCSTFNADLALSVAMTTVSSVLSIGMLPANLMLYSFLAYGHDEEESIVEALDFSALFLSLGVVLSAIVTGLLVGYRYDYKVFHMWANRLGSVAGIALILFGLFFSTGGDDTDTKLWNLDWTFYVGVAFPCLLGISLANLLSRAARLTPPETVAISIECCYQNTGIATSVAITMFSDPQERAQAVAVPLFYGLVEAVVICFYCLWAWKMGMTKAPADERFCVVVTKTYELDDHEDNMDETHHGVEYDVEEARTSSIVNMEALAENQGTQDPIDPIESSPSKRSPSWWTRIRSWWTHAPVSEKPCPTKADQDDRHLPHEGRSRLSTADYTVATTGSASCTSPSPRPQGAILESLHTEPDGLSVPALAVPSSAVTLPTTIQEGSSDDDDENVSS